MAKQKHGALGGIFYSLACFICFLSLTTGTLVGVNIPADGLDYQEADQVLEMVQIMGAHQVSLYDPDPLMLNAFAGFNIELLIGIPNSLLQSIGASGHIAAQWVKQNVLPYLPNTNISGIIVGDDVLTSYSIAAPFLVPSMRHIHKALVEANLEKQIKVSTSISSSMLVLALPPARAYFRHSYSSSVIQPLLHFLLSADSYFILNINSMDLFQQTMHTVAKDSSFLGSNRGMRDANLNLVHQNLVETVVYSALQALTALDFAQLPITVSIPSNAGISGLSGGATKTYIYELLCEDQKLELISKRRLGALDSIKAARQQLFDVGFINQSLATNQTWCVAKPGLPDSQLSTALNWVCGQPIVDCTPIQSNGICFLPNSYVSHCSYAFNVYYQKTGRASLSCDFSGTAMIVTTDPSTPGCAYTTR
ncbi:hypothetical protein O6H91_17G003600 [Diphasiastrum complanatum]|uniref:Uncharacterized protein n=4 Tax=Diphasiastrum complanatum TaxID=34168 RepID=A0ACC2B3T2_DIPCM|nr:hypothetical protein O6H91_24G003400 [Diphasiastrum complanatum]KAJ7513374.1 hypothetical protein O6H91_24G003400 [Diphasiastrum complanatum]KAJ7524404.1 hypothetical protein O6H91_17G003600 [Diphasiastrum complanatum]KAJ7524407.1 hypothetical protein O6H91_17G003600 [Diphasiastrum complanatum]